MSRTRIRRREFLKAIVAAAAAGTSVASKALADTGAFDDLKLRRAGQ